ncbi:PP2C family protein-serine/threonine phosphatase [Streptomyces sp. NPDC048696]|uniref:PP2C family protein-serine/threonine phosphatase n=1 Tax=Streptomyces sp. NPDC048696 TaxID=3365585 RepID=UPI0037142D37
MRQRGEGEGGEDSRPFGPGEGGDPEGPRGPGLVRFLPALLLVVGFVFDISTPPDLTAAALYSAAPLVAASFFGRVGTAVTGAGAVAAVLLTDYFHDIPSTSEGVSELFTVFTVAMLALVINRTLRRSGERLASARVIAETAQRAVLPEPAARIGGLQVAARYEAAQAGAFIGGDLFAVQDTPYGVRVVVGDVRGKGLGAVGAVAVVIGAFREAAEQEESLEGVAGRLERALAREGVRRDALDAFEGFTTAVLAEIPPGRACVRLVNRGHPEPLLLHADGALDALAPADPALPLGMAELGVWPDRVDTYPFPPGATLLLYTDGLSEARAFEAPGDFYDPRERLRHRIFPGPDELLDALVDDVRRHTGGGASDDMALLAVSRPGVRQPERRRTMPVVP